MHRKNTHTFNTVGKSATPIDRMTVEERRERKVELAELSGGRAGKHRWRTHHNAAQHSSSQPALQESYLQGSEQVIGMLQSLMLGEEEQEKPCVLLLKLYCRPLIQRQSTPEMY